MLTAHDEEGGRRERKRRRMLDHLSDVAVALFAARSFAEVTMEQIALAADVAKGTLYNHFPQKEALVAHWVRRQLAANLAEMLPDLVSAMCVEPPLRSLLRASASWSTEHREALLHYIRYEFARFAANSGEGAAPPQNDLEAVFERLIAAAQARGELRPSPEARRLANLLHHLHLSALLHWLGQPDADLASELDAVVDVFLRGCEA